MNGSRDPLAPFDRSTVAAVADEAGIDPGRLRRIVRRHQDGVRDLPGVDDIVYEWRRGLPSDPLVARTDPAYYLALPAPIWDEFAGSLDLSADERAALVAVHDRQARAALEATGREPDVLDGSAPMVLSRP